jgi:hypothetical protein
MPHRREHFQEPRFASGWKCRGAIGAGNAGYLQGEPFQPGRLPGDVAQDEARQKVEEELASLRQNRRGNVPPASGLPLGGQRGDGVRRRRETRAERETCHVATEGIDVATDETRTGAGASRAPGNVSRANKFPMGSVWETLWEAPGSATKAFRNKWLRRYGSPITARKKVTWEVFPKPNTRRHLAIDAERRNLRSQVERGNETVVNGPAKRSNQVVKG